MEIDLSPPVRAVGAGSCCLSVASFHCHLRVHNKTISSSNDLLPSYDNDILSLFLHFHLPGYSAAPLSGRSGTTFAPSSSSVVCRRRRCRWWWWWLSSVVCRRVVRRTQEGIDHQAEYLPSLIYRTSSICITPQYSPPYTQINFSCTRKG